MFWLLLFVTVTIISYLIYTRIWKPHVYWEERNVAHTKSWPILGDMAPTVLCKMSFFDNILKIYNECPGARYFGVNQFLTPTLVVRDLDLIKQITVKNFDYFEDHKVVTSPDVDPMFGKNLFAMQGHQWREMRAILSPAFTSAKMKSMFLFMSECAEKFTDHFLEQKRDTVVLEMKDTFTRYTSDVISSSVFGIECDSLVNKTNDLYVNGREATNFGPLRSLLFFAYALCPTIIKALKIPLFPSRISNFYRSIVKETIKVREERGILRPDMIHLLMEARRGKLKFENNQKDSNDSGYAAVEESSIGRQDITLELTDDDVTAQAMIFVFGGLDTSSVLMTFMSYELAINPDVQKKLRDEIDRTKSNCNGKVTYEALLGMKYMDMVVTETLRKWSPGFILDRLCVKPFTIEPKHPGEKPLTLEPNTVIWIPTIGFQRDPQYYPNPDKFEPERFSEENKTSITTGSYLPFGDGPRNCIGSRFALLENKVLFFHILSKFELTVVDKTVVPLVICKKQFILNAENGLWLGFKRRQ